MGDMAQEGNRFRNACGRCGVPAETGYLCDVCDSLVVRALTMLAPLVTDLRGMMNPLKSIPTDRVVVDTSPEPMVPNLEFGERADRLYATVADWVVSWIPFTESAGPAHLQGFNRGNTVTRLPEDNLPFWVASKTASWLIGHHDTIKQFEPAGRYAVDTVSALAYEAQALGYRPQRRRVRGKRCRVCRDYTLTMVWPLDGEPTLKCRACGGEFPCGATLARLTMQTR